MEWALVVQAVAVASFGPLAPYFMETCPAARLTMAAGMKNGEILRGPPSRRALCSRSMTSKPPMPEPMWTPTRLGFFGPDTELRHLHGFIRRGNGEVDEAPHFFDFFFLDEVEGVEVADFGGDLAGEGGGVKGGDAADAALARHQGLPDFGGGVADGAEQADAGDDDPSS